MNPETDCLANRIEAERASRRADLERDKRGGIEYRRGRMNDRIKALRKTKDPVNREILQDAIKADRQAIKRQENELATWLNRRR